MAHVNAPFAAFAVMLFLGTLVGMFFRNAANAYITDLVPAEERTTAFSATRIGLNIGWMTGPAIGAFLARTPFALLFGLTAAFCLVTALIAFKLCPAVPAGGALDSRGARQESLIRIILQDRAMLMLLGFGLIMFFSVAQFVSTLSVYSTKQVGISKNALGFLYTLNGAIVILFQLPLNRMLDRFNLHVRMTVGALMYVAAFIGFAASTCWLHLALCIGFLTLGEICAVTAIITAVSHLAPPDRVGRYMGAHGLVKGLGWALGPFFGSLLFEPLRAQPFLLWGLLSSGALVAACGFAGMALADRRKKAHENA
jgi:predicted MFS family arabinose efflux permease